MVGRQRHSSVWASLVRRVEGAVMMVVMMVVEMVVEMVVMVVMVVNLASGENKRSGKKCSHFNFPSKHK